MDKFFIVLLILVALYFVGPMATIVVGGIISIIGVLFWPIVMVIAIYLALTATK